jgi:hypothetical protein
MRFLRDWLIDTLTDEEAIPYDKLKFAFLIPSSILGGFIFAASGSWIQAIKYDFWMYLICWALVKPVVWIGEVVTRVILWLLPLYTVE